MTTGTVFITKVYKEMTLLKIIFVMVKDIMAYTGFMHYCMRLVIMSQ